MATKKAFADKDMCVACGVCKKECPKDALIIVNGCYAQVDAVKCIGCGICAKNCPAGCIVVSEV